MVEATAQHVNHKRCKSCTASRAKTRATSDSSRLLVGDLLLKCRLNTGEKQNTKRLHGSPLRERPQQLLCGLVGGPDGWLQCGMKTGEKRGFFVDHDATGGQCERQIRRRCNIAALTLLQWSESWTGTDGEQFVHCASSCQQCVPTPCKSTRSASGLWLSPPSVVVIVSSHTLFSIYLLSSLPEVKHLPRKVRCLRSMILLTISL